MRFCISVQKKLFKERNLYLKKSTFFTTNIIFFRAAKVTMACQWVPYYLGYKIVEIPQGLYKVWIYVRKAKMFLKRCILLYFTPFSCEPTQKSIPCSTWVSTIRCTQAPEEELELVGWLLGPGKLDLTCRVLFFNSVTIRIYTNLLKNVKFTLENQKFPTLWKKVTTMVGL